MTDCNRQKGLTADFSVSPVLQNTGRIRRFFALFQGMFVRQVTRIPGDLSQLPFFCSIYPMPLRPVFCRMCHDLAWVPCIFAAKDYINGKQKSEF